MSGLVVTKNRTLFPTITRVNPVDTTNIKCTTGKPGAPLVIVFAGIRLHTAMEIHPFCELINALEGVHTIGHYLPRLI